MVCFWLTAAIEDAQPIGRECPVATLSGGVNTKGLPLRPLGQLQKRRKETR
jgi:hypothetical protein